MVNFGLTAACDEVVGVLVAAADREHASAEHIDKAVHDPCRIAPIREHPASLSAKPRRRSAIARSTTPPFEVRRPPSKPRRRLGLRASPNWPWTGCCVNA